MSKSEGFPVDIKTTAPEVEFESQRLVLLEAGCGVGNCVFPLLEEDLNIFVYACDFSPRAVEFVKLNPLYCPERCHAFQCDLTKDDLRGNVPEGSVDVVTLIFVLSAVHPDKMKLALQNISGRQQAGGELLRPARWNQIIPSSLKSPVELFADAGLQSVSNDYVLRETVNKKEGLCVPRVFLQSKFTKPGNHRAPDATRPITELLTPPGQSQLLTPSGQSQSS
ncbi:hypothetical protein KUCAC02_014521 [Chaenocephalus aceratus]|uniref:Uncharacterized protein n=1 Tax=Chaenocephalus aceratus TaxID=36190 RepID=A0ACB9WE36_CHAAC|nr:hypothetical protein KUCAC02_014521 [Chaenocephalus aceratus]